ncbi:hypothetical protein SAMN05445060_0228 [Williamsia sterculiae]|uniref:Uncharacterized protein n=1 Tax=Williamsia sterculiae TaxID=1344003 RepID=A0A1N7CMF3_9NOCA|nr:hypothetical protein SAMN05445060_0228 [Williamsia sterculiae]
MREPGPPASMTGLIGWYRSSDQRPVMRDRRSAIADTNVDIDDMALAEDTR